MSISIAPGAIRSTFGGPPETIAHAAVYLASDEAAFVHGTVIDVDGGCGSPAVVGAG